MTGDRTYTAVVDRFENDLAVLLLEADGQTVDEIVIERDELPEEGRHVDAILTVLLEDDSVVEITYEERETVNRAEQAQQRFDELSQRPPSREDE